MKKLLVSLLMLVMLVSAVAVPAYAANTHDEPFDYFYADENGYGEDYVSPRIKENSTPVYVAITKCVSSKNCVQAMGETGGIYVNRTRSNSRDVEYVVVPTSNSGYCIHTHIYEDYGSTEATLRFRAFYNPCYVSGVWSPDSQYSHPFASWEERPAG